MLARMNLRTKKNNHS